MTSVAAHQKLDEVLDDAWGSFGEIVEVPAGALRATLARAVKYVEDAVLSGTTSEHHKDGICTTWLFGNTA